MQTVAVIPVLHHGVVQFGSYLTITENMGFVNDVVSLVLATRINYSSLIISNEIQNETPFQDLDQFMNGETKAEVIPSNSYIWTNQHSSLHNNDYEDAHTQPQSGDDLFDILGADLKNELLNNYWEKNSRKNLGASSETYSTNQENAESGIFSLNGTDNLLDAVVSKVQPSYNKHSMDDNVSCRTTLTDHTSTSSRPCGRAAPSSTSRNDLSQSSCVYDSWTNKGHNTNQNKSKTNRKRLKPGENPKPRPKDRQMIQDRVKELREIVPNGAKCSIDALLERTIKHMLFLQSVTKHSDKLKQCPDSKIMKGGGGGTTWAYEIGSQSLVCPIIVEDLPQPRQMLIEMICEERGSFLEIADIIRGLGLTILKGLVETKNKKILARFAVEANRDVTRMEIFLSLVRHMDKNSTAGVSEYDKVSKGDMIVPVLDQVG